MKKLLDKKTLTILLIAIMLVLNACSQNGSTSFIEIEDEEAQYKKIEQELKDLSTIKVKYIKAERYEEFHKKIYENYFRNKYDKDNRQEESYDGVNSIVYDNGKISQLMEYGDSFVSYVGTLFGEDYVYEPTDNKVIEEETKKLFELLGLEYGGKNGYVIERIKTREDNSVCAYICRYIEGKEISITGELDGDGVELSGAEEIQITFGNNQIIDIGLMRLTETVEVTPYTEDVLVDSPQ